MAGEPSARSPMYTALLLTGLGALGTALGGFMVVIHPQMSFARLGLLQGFAAGLMLCISMVDLLPSALEEIGFEKANIWFFGGVAFFAIIVAVLPEPQLSIPVAKTAKAKANGSSTDAKESKPDVDEIRKKREVLLSGLITALGIALHNFPEGVAVYLASLKSSAVGASLAFAIALHNIPEGVAVALPVYFATGSRWQGLKYAVVSGMAEPLGVLVLAYFTSGVSHGWVENMLAAVGGIMAFLSLHELLPLALEHAGKKGAVSALFVGMAVMSANLWLLDHWVMGGAGH